MCIGIHTWKPYRSLLWFNQPTNDDARFRDTYLNVILSCLSVFQCLYSCIETSFRAISLAHFSTTDSFDSKVPIYVVHLSVRCLCEVLTLLRPRSCKLEMTINTSLKLLQTCEQWKQPRLFRVYRGLCYTTQLCGECTMYLLDHSCMQTICLRFELSWWLALAAIKRKTNNRKWRTCMII